VAIILPLLKNILKLDNVPVTIPIDLVPTAIVCHRFEMKYTLVVLVHYTKELE